jgi:hypothetical protein
MKKWLLILALLICGYFLNQKIKQLSERTIGQDTDHLEKIEHLGEQIRNIPPKVITKPASEYDTNQPLTSEGTTTYPVDPAVVVPDHLPDGKPVEDPNQWKRELSGNTLVSCQTQIQYCEPPQEQRYQDGTVNTFCVAYARNCTNPESIQRTWANEEVFKPAAPPEADNNNPTEYNDYAQPYQPPVQQDYPEPLYPDNQYPQDPVAPVDPSTYLPPMPYAEPPEANHEVVEPPMSEY